MYNLQLIDSEQGGYFAFDRNDYPIDEGMYSELYTALFSTESQWLLDGCFETNEYNITSNTGIALKKDSSVTKTNLALIKKAVLIDLDRFTKKNPDIEVEAVELAYYGKTLLIIIELKGYTDAFNFIYNQTQKVLNLYDFKTF